MANKIKEDYTGQVFGHLIVLGRSNKFAVFRDVLWECECMICKIKLDVPGYILRTGRKKSCGKKECRYIKTTLSSTKKILKPIDYSTDRLRKIKESIGRQKVSYFEPITKGMFLMEYLNGLSEHEIAETYGVDREDLRKFIGESIELLDFNYKLGVKRNFSSERKSNMNILPSLVLKDRFTNPEILNLLSEDNASTITDQELAYCWIYFQTGNNDVAIRESGFGQYIPPNNPQLRSLLGIYLREKHNLVAYLKELQAKADSERYIDKPVIQQELIMQIKQLKEVISLDPSGNNVNARTQLLKSIEMLGKTIGAFTDNVNVTEVKASDAIDRLIELAKVDLIDGPIIEDNRVLTYEQKENEDEV